MDIQQIQQIPDLMVWWEKTGINLYRDGYSLLALSNVFCQSRGELKPRSAFDSEQVKLVLEKIVVGSIS